MKFTARKKTRLSAMLVVLLLFTFTSVFAQGGQNQYKGNRAWPDSLESVTVEGVVMIDTTHVNPYLLDINGDAVADYKLAFGPDWYVPESGAVRPVEGQTVSIVGDVHENSTLPLIVVFEIDGLVWREPVENWWAHQDWSDTLEIVTVTGTVLVDTTYFYLHYYLDENSDGEPDYFLNFGPNWYSPEGLTRPKEGVNVTIEGGVKDGGPITMIVVFKLDGNTWREPTGPPPWAGKWIRGKGKDTTRIHCPTDSLSWVDIPPGAIHGGGQGGPQFPDSVFCEFYQMYRDSLPGRPDSASYGFHFYFSNPDGQHVNGKGKMVRFVKRLRMAFNYGDSSDTPLAKAFNQNDAILKYWDSDTKQWIEASDIEVDYQNNVIYLNSTDIQTYYALFENETTTNIETDLAAKPDGFKLEQNYPNPFNPSTEISYTITENDVNVKIGIYNLQGQLIRMLVNQSQPAGQYNIAWDGKNFSGNVVSSGVYLYRLSAGNQVLTKRMILMK